MEDSQQIPANKKEYKIKIKKPHLLKSVDQQSQDVMGVVHRSVSDTKRFNSDLAPTFLFVSDPNLDPKEVGHLWTGYRRCT